ncbi:MAG: Uma2 family endonuclease [Saprospiraceae bacterium]|jgi:Uma2 family endonuclease|nr:Uma2 family endonuclease [Saprospiraceae bacterium]
MLHEELHTDTPVVDAPPLPLSDYEIERNKPMPNIIHGFLQHKIGVLLDQLFGNKFMFINELSLDSTPPSTPDLCIYEKRKLDVRTVAAKERQPPLTTIEIISPSQSLNELMHKAWDIYFPLGVLSAWIVIPEFKAIQVVLANDEKHYFDSGILTDPATGIQLDVEKVFEDLL